MYQGEYSGLCSRNLRLLEKEWVIFAEDLLARCLRISSLLTKENFFIAIILQQFKPHNLHFSSPPCPSSLLWVAFYKNITLMSKDFFQRNIELMNELRSEQFKVKEYLSRGKYRMKQKFFNKGKKHYDFDLNSQEYFHEELYDICFENSEIQEHFNSQLLKLLQEPVEYRNQAKFQHQALTVRRNQSEVRHLLYRFFNNRALDLQYEKYLIMQRLHNLAAEEEIGFVRSRINLIDKEIQMAMSRADRLSCEDYFEETYTLGGKPVPVNQNGQSIYKYLDEEDCWFSNIHRDDILVYTRHRLFRRDILEKHFYPLYQEQRHLVKAEGLDLLVENEEQLARNRQNVKEAALKKSKRMIALFQTELQSLSPGNLIEKQNINSFIYNIFGVEEGQLPLSLPLYPAIYLQLLQSYNRVLSHFFKGIQLKQHKELITIMPKLNNFCAILFKYQSKEVLEGKQEVKLGLQDDIDIKKELHTMLQQIWVNKYVRADFQRFDYRYRLQTVDWPLDTITDEHNRQRKHKISSIKGDTSIREIINIIKSTNYNTFRKHIKKHSELVLTRIKDKYYHMEKINRYNVLTDQEQTLQHLGGFFRIKFNQKETHVNSLVKNNAKLFFQNIMDRYIVANPVQIELEEMLRTIKIREMRVKLINLFNGMRCYHRNLALDLRVISGAQFSFQLDDEMLINSNKQSFQNFEKAVKDTQTYFQRESNDAQPLRLAQEQFVQHHTYQRSKLYKKDRVSCHFFGEDIPHVLVSHGKRTKNKILYQIANEDMEQLQRRVLENCTYFINRYQRYIKIKSLDEIVDRVQLLTQIYESQLQFQYQKFKLIQAYYYLYENTKEPIQAFKLSRIIVQLIYKVPQVDFEETSFAYAYQLNIEALKEEIRLVAHLTEQLGNAEMERCRTFHDKFARSINIPLSLQAYLYGDLERRGNKQVTKLQRMNSISSRISKDSRNRNDDKNLKVQFEIKQHAEEAGSSDEQSFDIQNYDEYLLRKNMDAIFDDMIGGDENGHVKEASPVNTIAIQNLVVNPRYEGGPHIKTNIFPQVPSTSAKQINMVNFAEVLYVVGNIRNLIQVLQKEFESEYGYVSKLYQAGFVRLLVKRMYKTCLNPDPQPPKWMAFETDDPYMETVTKCMRYFEEIMSPCLEPPTNVQLAIPLTFQKHHEKLPPFAALQCLDYHAIDSLIKLKKPVNSFRYKEHNLGLNFIQLIELQDRIWSVQLQRRALSKAYQNLAKHCDVNIQKSLTEYIVTGQSEVFLATQELKMFNHDINKHPVFGEAIDEVRQYLRCQMADIEVFRKYIQMAKRQLEHFLIMKYEIDKPFLNKRIDKSRILAPNDPKDIKKLKARIASMISIRSTQVLKQNNFLKIKAPIKNIFDVKFKDIAEGDYEERLQGRDKMSTTCISVLTSKYKRLLHLKLLDSYTNDLLLTANKLLVGTETCKLIKKLNNYVLSVPFLSKVFITPTEDKIIDNKILYDQAKPKKIVPLEESTVFQGQVRNLSYIYTLDQFLEQWMKEATPMTINIDKFEQRQKLINLNPPAAKDHIFKWVFQIPDLHIQPNERDSDKHLINLFHPFTGKLTQLSYHESSVKLMQPPRNKYLTLMTYYKAIVDYIQANIFLISLQIEEQILVSLENIIKKHVNFEERYFLTDQNSIRQTINSLQNQDLSVVYKYVINFIEIHKDVKKKIEDKNYIDKKQHWVVHDEITDFILSKVQGYGLIRKSYMPLYEDLKELKSLKTNPIEYLKLKTNNIYKCIHISSCEAYLNEINEKQSDYFAYFSKINQWLCHCSKLQNYALNQDKNNRINITEVLDENQDQKQRFSNGVYVPNNNTLVNRLKNMIVVPAVNLEQFLQKSIYKPINNEQILFSMYHNNDFLLQGIHTFKLMGEKNRLKLFARVRYHYQLSDNFLSTRPHTITTIQKETLKASYYDLLFTKKMFVLAGIFFTGKVKQPINAQQFKEAYMELKQINQIYTHNLYQNLQKFKQENKIQFSKSQISLIGRNEGGNDQEYNKIIKQVLSVKLLKEQLRFRILNESIRLLKAERIPKQQAKRIINTSLIPRVHLISSYSSPLITERKTYISQQYKLSFLQAFINRFRNKVSRVDLLSSGYGFVITVPDLEDCVNYMNKLLFTFTEKQFKNRIQTFSQYHDILLQAINDKNKTINEQSALIKYLQNKNNNLLQAQYLSKVTKLLHQKTIIQDKLLMVENNINGLEDRVRKVVQIQYDKKIQKLQKQNEELKSIFSKVKHLHMINTKQAAKNDFLDIINYYKDRINELLNKKIDFSISFDDNKSPEKGIKVQQEQNRDKYRSQQKRIDDRFVTQDLQRCKLGEDILFDAYYTTKLINKMRLFNLFKMGSKRLKFDQQQFRKNEQLAQLHKIQDSVMAQSERQILIRGQLSKVQQQLSRKCLELEKLKQTFDVVQNEKTKLKILMQSKQKKIEQKDREIDELKKKLEEKEHAASVPIEKQRLTEQAKETSKLGAIRKEKKYKKVDKTAFLTNFQQQSNQTTLNLYQRFQLSSKDTTWRQKCEQLYIQNKKLVAQLEQYRNSISIIPDTPKKQGMSLNLRNRRESVSQSAPHKNQGRFPNISFKYSILKQGHY